MLRLKSALKTLALALSVAGLFTACGDDETTGLVASVSEPAMFFNRVSTFAVCEQVGSSCESDEVTAAEIAAAAGDQGHAALECLSHVCVSCGVKVRGRQSALPASHAHPCHGWPAARHRRGGRCAACCPSPSSWIPSYPLTRCKFE